MSDSEYIPVTLGDAVVGHIKINDDGSFDGTFQQEWLNLIRDMFDGRLLEVIFAGRPMLPIDPVDFNTQYQHFLDQLGKQQRGETK